MDNPLKAKRSIPPATPIAMAALVLSRPGFMAFARIVGLFIADGRTVDAMAMLVAIGAPADVAHKVIEDWPTRDTRRMPTDTFTTAEEGACRLAHFIDDIDAYDWPKLLTAAVTAAKEKRNSPP